MTTKKNEEIMPDCSTAGMGFARTGGSNIASESCGLSSRGFGNVDSGKEDVVVQKVDNIQACSTAGMGFARTDRTRIDSDNCAFPSRGFGTTDFGKKTEEEESTVILPLPIID